MNAGCEYFPSFFLQTVWTNFSPKRSFTPYEIHLQQRMSFSKYNVNAMTDPLSALPSPIIRRPRQNSVFVGSSTMAILNPPPRRVKSAIDIQHLVVNEHSPTSLTGNRKGTYRTGTITAPPSRQGARIRTIPNEKRSHSRPARLGSY
jgi:hypothetical protein